jgi:hypothetical protein
MKSTQENWFVNVPLHWILNSAVSASCPALNLTGDYRGCVTMDVAGFIHVDEIKTNGAFFAGSFVEFANN